jgi:hypothetical protein
MLSFAAAVAVSLLSSLPAFADISYLPRGARPLDAISLSAEIKQGDAAAFMRIANTIPNGSLVNVDLDSQGGDVDEAVAIGRIVRARSFFTRVMPEKRCASACVFVLVAGVVKTAAEQSELLVHRPTFNSSYFAILSPEEARQVYNRKIEELRTYVSEMGGSEELFRLMLSVSSDKLRLVSSGEAERFGLSGQDPAWEELNTAKMVEHFGSNRWPLIKRCWERFGPSHEAACISEAVRRYPDTK